LKSSDRGATWTNTRVDTSREAPRCNWSPGCFLGFFGPSALLAVDAEGAILLAYNANVGDIPGAPQRMWIQTSTDGLPGYPHREASC